jgi:hypothetical protein
MTPQPFHPAKQQLHIEAMLLKSRVGDQSVTTRMAMRAVIAVADAAEVIKGSTDAEIESSYAIADQIIGTFVKNHINVIESGSIILLVSMQGLNIRTGEVHGSNLPRLSKEAREPRASTDGLYYLQLCNDLD